MGNNLKTIRIRIFAYLESFYARKNGIFLTSYNRYFPQKLRLRHVDHGHGVAFWHLNTRH